MEDEPVTAEPVVEKKKKGGGGLKKMLFIALPVLALAGGGAWWMLGGSSAEVKAAEEPPIDELGIVPLETFLVNLTDPGGNRFLKVTLQLVFESEKDAKHVEENAALMGHARSAILELLTEQNAQTLITAEGKKKLKDDVKTHIAKVFGKLKVVDVLFSEFVVQF